MAPHASSVRIDVLAAALWAGFVALAAPSAVAATLGEVIAWCASPRIEGDDKLCAGYLSAATELLRSPDPVTNGGHQVCVPPGDPRKTMVPFLVAWRKQHPEADRAEAIAGTGDALAARYPCK